MGILIKTNFGSRKELLPSDPFESFLSAIWQRQEDLKSNRMNMLLEKLTRKCGESTNEWLEASGKRKAQSKAN
jgi:hypothetical protein